MLSVKLIVIITITDDIKNPLVTLWHQGIFFRLMRKKGQCVKKIGDAMKKKQKKLVWYLYFPYLCKRINYFRQLEENFRCMNFRKG